MRFHDITHDDMLNGEGLRVVLWVAGCNHHCPGCQNPQTWDPDGGIEFTVWEEAEFYEWLSKDWTKGATFSGGDPLYPSNRGKILSMMKHIKERWPDKDIWLYTGYLVGYDNGFMITGPDAENLKVPELEYADIIIDSRFDIKVREQDLAENKNILWRGSSNQRIIDVKETIANSSLTLRDADGEDKVQQQITSNCCSCCS